MKASEVLVCIAIASAITAVGGLLQIVVALKLVRRPSAIKWCVAQVACALTLLTLTRKVGQPPWSTVRILVFCATLFLLSECIRRTSKELFRGRGQKSSAANTMPSDG